MEKLLYLSTEKLRREPFSNSNLTWYRKIFCVVRISRFKSRTITISRRVFYVSQHRKFGRQPIKVSEKLEYRKVLCIMGWYHDFPSNVFSFTVPRNFVGEPFCVSDNFLYGSKNESEGLS